MNIMIMPSTPLADHKTICRGSATLSYIHTYIHTCAFLQAPPTFADSLSIPDIAVLLPSQGDDLNFYGVPKKYILIIKL